MRHLLICCLAATLAACNTQPNPTQPAQGPVLDTASVSANIHAFMRQITRDPASYQPAKLLYRRWALLPGQVAYLATPPTDNPTDPTFRFYLESPGSYGIKLQTGDFLVVNKNLQDLLTTRYVFPDTATSKADLYTETIQGSHQIQLTSLSNAIQRKHLVPVSSPYTALLLYRAANGFGGINTEAIAFTLNANGRIVSTLTLNGEQIPGLLQHIDAYTQAL